MKVELVNYHVATDCFDCKEIETGEFYQIDLTVDNTFQEISKIYKDANLQTIDDREKICKSLIGKKVEIKEIRKLPVYYAQNVKFIV